MMAEPEHRKSETEELYEWVIENGQLTKITSKNSNGRTCGHCGCKCPCKCEDCRPICCSFKKGDKDLHV